MNKEIMKNLFPKESKLREQFKCPFCKKDMSTESFRDDLSCKEFKISGMCQRCQDKFFK